MHKLRLVNPERAAGGVHVRFSLEGDRLVAAFEVEATGEEPSVNPDLPADASAWGLWDWDVVELFVRANARPTYYEFQVSPLGQYFELEIFEPRKRFNRDFTSGFRQSVTRSRSGGWQARFEIPLSRLGWDGRPESLVGNAFAILGPAGHRTYWSLFLPPQQTPDFHLPDRFRPLPLEP